MEKKIAAFLSYLLHPLLAAFAGILVLTHSGTYIADLSSDIKNLIYLIIVTLTLVLPVCLIPFYMYFKIVRNLEISERHERLIPLYITLVAYVTAYFLIRRLPVSQLYSRFLFSACLSVLIVLIISNFWKISVHMTGLGGLTGLVLALSIKLGADMVMYLLIFLILSGVAGYARLRLNAHSGLQVLVGYLTGLITVLFLVLI
jgi:membrane-associated phospholipid phosphatase